MSYLAQALAARGMHFKCGHELSAGDLVWLTEDDGLSCDDCHKDDLAEDPSDLRDHGSPYILTATLGGCMVLEPRVKEEAS